MGGACPREELGAVHASKATMIGCRLGQSRVTNRRLSLGNASLCNATSCSCSSAVHRRDNATMQFLIIQTDPTVYMVNVMILDVISAIPHASHATHPSTKNASTVRPSDAPERNEATSSGVPNVTRRRPASLTDATRDGTAACKSTLRSKCKPPHEEGMPGGGARLTSVVASSITPRRLVDFAKLTASRTLRQRRSASSSGPEGCKCRSDGVREMPQYEAKKTASGGQCLLGSDWPQNRSAKWNSSEDCETYN